MKVHFNEVSQIVFEPENQAEEAIMKHFCESKLSLVLTYEKGRVVFANLSAYKKD